MIALLDIEGTVCSISFVKDVLYPYFLDSYRAALESVTFPLTGDDHVSTILSKFPPEHTGSLQALEAHIDFLVSSDIKDPVLKSFQGVIWKNGYASGELKAPIYPDAIAFLERSPATYIYSSGSVPAQKLLFAHVDVNGKSQDLTPKLKGYFDITTSGYKQEAQSYTSIVASIGCEPADVVFYSDNVAEVRAALAAGLHAKVVIRPGNAPLSAEDHASFECIDTFANEL